MVYLRRKKLHKMDGCLLIAIDAKTMMRFGKTIRETEIIMTHGALDKKK